MWCHLANDSEMSSRLKYSTSEFGLVCFVGVYRHFQRCYIVPWVNEITVEGRGITATQANRKKKIYTQSPQPGLCGGDYYTPPPKRGHLAMMLSDICLSVSLSDVCLSVAYIGPKSRIERPRKTKIGTEVAHVTHYSDSGHHFQSQKACR